MQDSHATSHPKYRRETGARRLQDRHALNVAARRLPQNRRTDIQWYDSQIDNQETLSNKIKKMRKSICCPDILLSQALLRMPCHLTKELDMPGAPRSQIFDPRQKGAYHCYARCVRRSRLLGEDEYSNRSFDHRRTWVEDRIRFLVKWFAIDVCFESIMGNHYHIVLRNRPEIVDGWTDREIVRRAIEILPRKCERLGVKIGSATNEQLDHFEKDAEMVAELRLRLSHISWFMRQRENVSFLNRLLDKRGTHSTAHN